MLFRSQVEISIFDPEFHLYYRWTHRLKLDQVYLLQVAGSEDVVAYLSFVLCRESSDTNTRLVFSKWRL